MVVLSAAVCTKHGKALFSRQFVEITRVRLEGLLAAFPKLMGTGKQHTFIETESVRYVYQPLENLYMLLLTNKSSNILEDLETLHLLAKIVPEYCRVLDEEEVLNKVFELISAFDEVIAVGYREKVTLQQIKTFMEMDSHEERIFEMVQRDKERDEAVKREKEMEKMRKEAKERPGAYTGMGGSRDTSASQPSSWQPDQRTEIQEPTVVSKERKPAQQSLGASGGVAMKLQKKEGSTSKFMREMEKEEGIPIVTRKDSTFAAAATAPQESVNIDIVENVNVQLDLEGGLKSFMVKGDLNLSINEPELTRVTLNLNPADNRGFSFNAHPNINKPRFTKEKVIALNPNKAFPSGTPLNVLKWRWQTTDESLIPLTVNCWPTPAGDGTTIVNMEYELKNDKFALGDVSITIPIPGGSPAIGEVSNGTAEFDQKKRVLLWRMDLIDGDTMTGSLEFTVPSASGDKASAFVPINVNFISRETFCDINVESVVGEDGNAVAFSQTKTLSADEYAVV